MAERIWTVEEANAALARVTGLVEHARDAAKRLREDAETTRRAAPHNGHGRRQHASEQLESVIHDLEADGIVLRDIDRGLVDFPAMAPSGRSYWLCWIVGEPAVEWWHWPEDGFAGRTPLSEPPA